MNILELKYYNLKGNLDRKNQYISDMELTIKKLEQENKELIFYKKFMVILQRTGIITPALEREVFKQIEETKEES